ncbi:hypothetical protein GCM10008994_27810 [Halorubrum ejinorense]|uniref:Uncharacterized protein n=1 Tax=Halorubrum ejinorense TaxID=425309 RepID=A0AAV3SWB5_9EURY
MRSAGGYPSVAAGRGLALVAPARVSFAPSARSPFPDYDSRTFRPTASPNDAAPVAGSRS